MINDTWLQRFPQSYNVFKAGGCSDHFRSRIYLQSEAGNKRRKPFKFINVVAEMDDFKPLVENYWNQTEPIFLSTSALFRLSKKLKGLKPLIRKLGKNKMGNLVMKAKEAYQDLCMKQDANLNQPSPSLMKEEIRATMRWERVADLEEKYLKQKSKLHWLRVGDKNNNMFHRAVNYREAKNSIREIECMDGRVLKNVEDIKKEVEDYFTEFLQFIPHNFKGVSVTEL